MEQEEWKPIENFEGHYEVSSFGRIRSVTRTILVLNRWGRTNERVNQGKIITLCNGRAGYNQLSLSNVENGIKRTTFRSARIVGKTFIPNPENKPEINHIDCNKKNDRVDNLEWSTHKENDDHAIKNKLHPFGENHGRAKLTETQVQEIRSKYIPIKYPMSLLSKEYNVGRTTIFHILKSDTWQ